MGLKEIGIRTKRSPGRCAVDFHFFQTFSGTDFCKVTCLQVDSFYLLIWLDPSKKTVIVSAFDTAQYSYLLAMCDISAKDSSFCLGGWPQTNQWPERWQSHPQKVM